VCVRLQATPRRGRRATSGAICVCWTLRQCSSSGTVVMQRQLIADITLTLMTYAPY